MAYELIPRSERCDKHRLAAAWIESLGRCEDHAELLADHYVRALELARLTSGAIGELVQPARRALAGAGERAASLGAYAAASRHYERALELCPDDDPERAQLLLRYAKAIFLIDHDDAIAGAVDRARRALIESGDVEGTAQLDVMLGELAAERGDAGTAIDLLGRAAEAFVDRPTSRAKAETYIVNAAYRALLGAGGSRPYAELGLDMAEQLGALELRAAAHDRLGVAWLSSGDVDAARYHAEQSLRLTEGLIAPARVRATGNLASLFGDLGELVRSRRMHERCLELATALGAHRDIRWSSAELAIDRYFAGEWDDATTALDAYLGDSIAEPYMMDASGFATRARMRAAAATPSWRWLTSRHASRAVAAEAAGSRSASPFRSVRGSAPRATRQLRPRCSTKCSARSRASTGSGHRRAWSTLRTPCGLSIESTSSLTPRPRPTPPSGSRRLGRSPPGSSSRRRTSSTTSAPRPEAALARLHAARELVAAGESSAAAGHLDEALAFWRSVEATAYIDAAEALLEATHRR